MFCCVVLDLTSIYRCDMIICSGRSAIFANRLWPSAAAQRTRRLTNSVTHTLISHSASLFSFQVMGDRYPVLLTVAGGDTWRPFRSMNVGRGTTTVKPCWRRQRDASIVPTSKTSSRYAAVYLVHLRAHVHLGSVSPRILT